MLNNYAEAGGGFNSSHGQTSRPPENQKQQNIGSSWSYNSQLEGMYYGSDHQPVFMGPYEGSTKHSNYSQYPAGTIHQPVPTPVVKCHEACCQHFQDRYPLNPAPLRYQPSGPVQPRYADLTNSDSRQYFSDRRSLSRKKVYPAENGYPAIPDRHFSQYMGRGQLHVADSRQQMQMMRSQYPMYPPYWSSARGWTAPRVNCPPPPSYHQSLNQGAQLQAGLKMADGNHYIDPSAPKPMSSQHRRGVTTGSGGPEIIRPIPESKRSSLDPNLQSCYEFGYPTGFVPFSEVNKIQGGGIGTQSSNSSCKMPSDKQYHPHQMQYSMQGSDRNMMNCSNPINDLSYPLNFPMAGNDSYLRPGMEDGQQIPDTRKLPLQYDSSLGKKRPDLDLRQYLATWEDDEDENTRLSEPLLGNNGAPYIVVDCRSLEGEAATKLQERYKTSSSQNCTSKTRSSSPSSGSKRAEDQSGQGENFPSQTSYAPSMPTLISDSEKNMSFWNGNNREGEGIIGKGGAFQPLDCSKRDGNLDPNAVPKRPSHPNSEMPTHKMQGTNDSANMSFDALVSYYGDNRRMVDGNCDFVEMTERLVNISEKSSTNNRNPLDHQLPTEITRPCDPRLQQSQLGNNPSIYNKMTPRYPPNNYQHFKPNIPADPYYSYKHPMSTSKYFGYDNPQIVDQNYEYHKIASDFDNARLFNNKDVSKDPRRMFHQEVDKSVESSFLDPIRKAQISDCFQDKSNLEFAAVDPDQFITPIIIKKSELDNRDKTYSEKSSAIRERMEVINSENQSHSEKTVLITSQNGPPEIFRVPFSPEKESLKDNMVTLHSGDQTKSNSITVEVPVPYVQQYSTLVKLSEEISRAEKDEGKTGNNDSDLDSSNKTCHEEFKKPTSFKLKRLPNSKEWAVEGKDCSATIRRELVETSSETESLSSSCEVSGERDVLKSNVAVSNLNMPSLDDIRDGDENCDDNQSKSKRGSEASSPNKTVTNCEEVNKNKYNSQTPQMAIVQPMKLTQSESEQSNSDLRKLSNDDCKESPIQSSLSTVNLENMNQISFDSDKIDPDDDAHLELMTGSDISKHENFRTHKKIQSSFTNAIPNCLSSPNEDFLHPQDINNGDPKESFSPFQVYSDCDMNAQITDYFKIDERTATGEKILDGRMPSSPGVEGMFEDINHSNQNQLFQSKNCNFQDLTDPNLSSLSSHNSHFQSFSSIFSDDIEKSGRSDGSVLQMNEKKYLKHIFDDIEHHEISNSLNERVAELEPNSANKKTIDKSDEVEKSPPIPPISLKLNETKKIWCIAKKHQSIDEGSSLESSSLEPSFKHTDTIQETFGLHTVHELKDELAQAIHKEAEELYSANYETDIEASIQTTFSEKITKHFEGHKEKSDLTQSLFNEKNKQNIDQTFPSIQLTDEVSDKSLTPTENLKEVQEECMSRSKYANKCLSLIKYNPRIKVLERITLLNKVQSITSESLVFDENGTHFPKQCVEEKSNLSESMSIAKDILDLVITRAVHHIHDTKIDGGTDNMYKQWNTLEITDVRNTIPTVIKFDSSRSQHLMEFKEQECIAKTTEMFIQHEKENCQHYSVIKTISCEDYTSTLNEKKRTIRSIFSPMSEDGNEHDREETYGSNIKNYVKKVSFQEENIPMESEKSDSCLDVEMNNIVDYSSTTAQTNCKENVPLNMLATENNATTQKVMLNSSVSNIIEDEEFKGFGSPKLDCDNKQEGENFTEDKLDYKTKSNCEIDDALELMGLSNREPRKEDCGKKGNELEPGTSLAKPLCENSLESLQDSLENNENFDKSLNQNDCSGVISSDMGSISDTNGPGGEISYMNSPTKSQVSKQIGIVDPIVKEYTICDENKISDSTQDTDHCLTLDTLNISCDIDKNELSKPMDIKTNENKNHCPISCESQIQETKINSPQKGFNKDANNQLHLSSENPPTSSSECRVKEVPTITNDRQTSLLTLVLEEELCLQENSRIEDEHVEKSSSCTMCNSSLQDTDNPKIKEYIEDFEARLETSVIVRNKSCIGVKPTELSELCTTVGCEQSLLSNNSKPRVLKTGSEESHCSSGNNENEINICTEKDVKNIQNYLGSSNVEGNVVGDNNEKCLNQFTEKESTTIFDNHIQSLQMDCEPNISSNSSMRFPGQNDSSVNFENHNLEGEMKQLTENQSSHTNQTSVITSKYFESNSSISPEITVEVCEIDKPCYCAGESIFLSLSEETKACVKNSKTSYFYEYKKRKWQKFSRSLNTKMYLLSDFSNVQENSQERDCTVINFSTKCDDLLEKCANKNTEYGVNENSHQILNSITTKLLKDNLMAIPEIELEQFHCSVNGKFIPTKRHFNTKDKLIHLENKHEHAKQDLTECLFDSLTVEKDHSSTILAKDCPVPLKVKPSFFTSNETNNCFVKRDSLKILEPEAVLKEIFSPDPETDDSESKENECPENLLQERLDSPLQQVDLVSRSSIVPTFLPNITSNQCKLNDFDFRSQVNGKENLQKSSDHYDLSSLPCIDPGFNDNPMKPQDWDEETNISPCQDNGVLDDISIQTIDQQKEAAHCVLDSSKPATVNNPKPSDAINVTIEVDNQDVVPIPPNKKLSATDPSILIRSDHETVVLPSQNYGIISSSTEKNDMDEVQTSLNQQSDMMNPEIELVSLQNNEDKELLCTGSDLSCVTENPTDSYDKTVSSPANTQMTNSSLQITSNVTDLNGQNVDLDTSVAEKTGSDETVEFRQKTREKDLTMMSDQCLGINGRLTQELNHDKRKTFETLDINESPLELTKRDESTMSAVEGSNLKDSSNKLAHQEDPDNTLIVVSNHDSFLNIQTPKKKDKTVKSNDINTKSLDKEQDESNDCQNIKITSVQDSLRSNQHLNTETFPLHCLVEAALALESVDSKRRLLKNSNFSDLFCQSSEQFRKPPESENTLANNSEVSDRNNLLSLNSTNVIHEEKICSPNSLTRADREIFSKFEETNYNLRASTRIVTSSSSNIIPYSKRKYGLKSSKLPITPSEKQKKTDSSVTEKSRTKKRRGCFTYPRSKRRKRVLKEKPKCQQLPLLSDENGNAETDKDDKVLENIIEKKSISEEKAANNKIITAKNVQSTPEIEKFPNLLSESNAENNISQTDFGGPLIIASENPSTQGNIFCVRVNSDKMDEYVNNINLGELEMLSDNGQNVFKDSISDGETDVPNMTLENGTSLVIIIEELDDGGKSLCDDANKLESDIILGSIGNSVSCSEMLSTEFSVNESCICPPDFEIHGNCENKTLTEKPVLILENEHLMQKTTFELNIEDSYEKYSSSCHQELLTTNCYEELNENLVNDIGNWPFVEEEVAEFDTNTELPNKIPEEGRKIELKCSLPWKKIFNMSKNKKKKSKAPRKISGLEMGPANVEVRLKAPSAEWKVISDYHENSSPVVKVRRLILQRDSDVSSHSEKDSEEENENKRCLSHSSVDSEPKTKDLENSDQAIGKIVSNDENWQPVVLLTRNKELDELTLSLDPKLHSQKTSLTYIPQFKGDAGDKIGENFKEELIRDDFQVGEKKEEFQENENDDHFQEKKNGENSRTSFSETETPETTKDTEQFIESCSCSQSSVSSTSSQGQISENKSVVDPTECFVECKSYRSGKTDRVQVYETYSPSGCNSTLTNETVYSPSDPHYSPDPDYKDSDIGASSEDPSCNNISSDDDDVFINNVDSFQSICVTAKDTHEEASILGEINLEANTLSQLEENRNKIADAHKMLDNMISSQRSYVSDTCSLTESHTENSFDIGGNSVEENGTLSLSQTYEEDLNKIAEQSKEYIFDVGNTEMHSSDSSKEIILERKKKSKRKMPKNFFVRKKLRKYKGDCDSTDEKSILEGEINSQKSEIEVFSPCQDTVSGSSESAVNEPTAASSPLKSPLSETQSRKSSSPSDDLVNTESDLSLVCENSRLQSVYNVEESSPVRLSETPLTEKFEVKQRLRDGERGLKRPCEGHSKEDTKRRRKKLKRCSNRCQECGIDFQNKEELSRHNAYRHARRRELHHCLLCQRSFSSAVRHSLHIQGRSHRHLELTQRHTMHAMHTLLVGGQYPHIPPLSRAELRALQWRPSQPGYTHFYHDLTPLQAALQEHNTDISEDALSEELMPND